MSGNWLEFTSAYSQMKQLLWTLQFQNTTVAQTETQKPIAEINTHIYLMTIHTNYMCNSKYLQVFGSGVIQSPLSQNNVVF